MASFKPLVLDGDEVRQAQASDTLTDGGGNALVSAQDLTALLPAPLPPGSITMYGGASVPAGWLPCNGSEVSRATYAALFAAIGTEHGTGNGSTTFNLPDLRGRTALGAGTGAGLTTRPLGAAGGTESHTLSPAELAVHAHTIDDPSHQHPGAPTVSVTGRVEGILDPADHVHPYTESVTVRCEASQGATTGITVNAAGSGVPHNNMPPWLAVNFIIKA